MAYSDKFRKRRIFAIALAGIVCLYIFGSLLGCAAYSVCGSSVTSVFRNVAQIDVEADTPSPAGMCHVKMNETGVDSTPGTTVISKALDKVPNAPVVAP